MFDKTSKVAKIIAHGGALTAAEFEINRPDTAASP